MPTPYEQLRKRVNELLPDRLTLGFGCETDCGIYLGEGVGVTHQIKWPYYFLSGLDNKTVIGQNFKPDVIIGPPLTLADVLRAIPKRGLSVDISPNRIYLRYGGIATGGRRTIDFDYSLPVKDWSEVTLEAVYELIK